MPIVVALVIGEDVDDMLAIGCHRRRFQNRCEQSFYDVMEKIWRERNTCPFVVILDL